MSVGKSVTLKPTILQNSNYLTRVHYYIFKNGITIFDTAAKLCEEEPREFD